ncbi:MAG TPA: allantoinase AllB [Vicinamibacterales bacterium]|nr:allantoinase AllB [Vicinamibacterales bacterium]
MTNITALVVRGERVILPDGVRPAAIHVRDGRITAIESGPGATGVQPTGDERVIDAGDAVVSPGLVDSHVHINDPGRESWEGFEHATRAAAAGGVTTLVDMPLNSIPATTTVAGLEAKRRAAAGKCHVDVGFWGGVVPGNARDLEPLARAGVLGFKSFLCPSGVDEFEHVTENDLREAMPVVARLGVPLLAHAELPARLGQPHGNPRRYISWLDSRPPAAEHGAIDLLIGLAREFRTRVHIVHLASADALPSLVAARADGVAISVETCPHYLTFAAEEIRDGATAFKCAPPIRARDQREGLWRGLIEGVIDLVATDHSPAPPGLKRLDDGDFVQAWGGIASLQIGLPAVWSGARPRGVSVERMAEWMSAAPARLAGLDRVKGRIAIGQDADFVIWNPDAEFRVDAAALHHRHPVTPYHGLRLVGRVQTTILRGQVVFDAGEIIGPPQGRLVSGVV